MIEIKTLIDITNTEVRRINQGSELEFNQYKNWCTLLQCLTLRAIINFDKLPTVDVVDIKNLGFGKKYSGKHKVWTFYFETDQPDCYLKDKDPIGLLKDDLDRVPIIINLQETINIKDAAFIANSAELKNIVVNRS